MSKRNKNGKQPPMAARVAKATVNFTADTISGVLMGVFKILGSIFLSLLIAGMLFAVIFAYYVKSSLAPSLSITLEDYQLSESGAI